MANEFAGEELHSAEYFGDTRNDWYNHDYLALLRARFGLGEVRSVLDVGCGAGHWSRVVARMVPETATLVGVDREPRWVAAATERAAASGLGDRFRYEVGNAETLPFPDGSFDLVTCQTLLIHCPDPAAVLREMVRVARPGGRLLVAEPNNLAGTMLSPHALALPIESLLGLVELEAHCERGKRALGEGDNSFGEKVPGLLASLGLEGVQAFVNDRARLVLPPYTEPENAAWIQEVQDSHTRELWMWDAATTARYFAAGGGSAARFEALWALAGEASAMLVDELRARTYAQAGGSVIYVVCGAKAQPAEGLTRQG